MTDTQGSVVARYRYDAFGDVTFTGGTDPALAARNPLRYRSYYLDTATGLYYLPARYYEPASARFLSPDPAAPSAGDPLSLNAYAYCLGDPVNLEDPSGAIAEWDDNGSIDTWDVRMNTAAHTEDPVERWRLAEEAQAMHDTGEYIAYKRTSSADEYAAAAARRAAALHAQTPTGVDSVEFWQMYPTQPSEEDLDWLRLGMGFEVFGLVFCWAGVGEAVWAGSGVLDFWSAMRLTNDALKGEPMTFGDVALAFVAIVPGFSTAQLMMHEEYNESGELPFFKHYAD